MAKNMENGSVFIDQGNSSEKKCDDQIMLSISDVWNWWPIFYRHQQDQLLNDYDYETFLVY